MPLSPQHEQFVVEYLKDFHVTEAARRAGYSEKTAHSQGSRLLKNAAIWAAIQDRLQARLGRADLTAHRVLEELRRLAFSDVRSLFDEQGNLRPLHTLTAEEASCIAGLEVIIKNAEAGDGKTDKVHKIKIWDKTRTLEMLAKHFALLTERVEHSGGIKIIHELPE